MFPVGDLAKRDVRAIAREQGIPTHAKKDSTGICFIGERPFREFLARYLPTRARTDRDAGRASAVGRAPGSRVLHARPAAGPGRRRHARWQDARPGSSPARTCARNALIVVQGHDHPRLYADAVETRNDCTDRRRAAPSGAALRCQDALPDGGRTRARSSRVAAGRWRVRFDAPQWAPTPGQYLVLYDGDVPGRGGDRIGRRARGRARARRSGLTVTKAPRERRFPRLRPREALNRRCNKLLPRKSPAHVISLVRRALMIGATRRYSIRRRAAAGNRQAIPVLAELSDASNVFVRCRCCNSIRSPAPARVALREHRAAGVRGHAHPALDRLFAFALVLLLALLMPAHSQAQSSGVCRPTSKRNQPNTFPQDQPDALLAPIALYPDDLLAQVLMASTYPLEVVEAARFVQQNPALSGAAL